MTEHGLVTLNPTSAHVESQHVGSIFKLKIFAEFLL